MVAKLEEIDACVLKAYADNSMNASEAARELFMHRNTLVYHLEKIKKLTGLNPCCFYDLAKLMSTEGEERWLN